MCGTLVMHLSFITMTYIFNAKIGFNVPWTYAYIIGVVLAVAYVAAVWYGKKRAAKLAAK